MSEVEPASKQWYMRFFVQNRSQRVQFVFPSWPPDIANIDPQRPDRQDSCRQADATPGQKAAFLEHLC